MAYARFGIYPEDLPMRRAAIVIALLITTVCTNGMAQSAADKATAQALFDTAKQLLKEGKYSEACPKFAESQRLDPAPGTLLNLADCYERSGMTASAWATWLEAAAATHNAGQAERERMARERAEALKGKLVSITVTVPDPSRVDGLSLKRNSDTVGTAVWGVPVPVDPGSYTIVASAPGRRTWQTVVAVKAGGQPVVVTIPTLEREASAPAPAVAPVPAAPAPAQPVAPAAPAASPPPAAPPATTQFATLNQPAASSVAPLPAAPAYTATASPAPSAAPPAAPAAARDQGAGSHSVQRPIGYVVTGLGVVGLGVGAIFGLEAKSKNDDSLAQCRTDTLCSQAGYDLRQQALDAATYSTVAFGLGAAALIGGIVLIATAPSSASPAPASVKAAALRLEPTFNPSSASLTVQGAF